MPEVSPLRLGDKVTLLYRLSCAGQELVDTFPDAPETFTLGDGELAPGLESLLLGLPADAHRSFQLEPGAAFGVHDPFLVHTLPRDEFPAEMELAPGHQVEFTLPNGQTLNGTVLELTPLRVQVDFNHPLASLPVEFEVHILAVEPTNGS